MDEMTQQNAALVEETNAAIQSAATQVEDLQAAVSFFKTGNQPEFAPVKSPRPQKANNAVHTQQRKLARKVAASSNAALKEDDEWQEF